MAEPHCWRSVAKRSTAVRVANLTNTRRRSTCKKHGSHSYEGLQEVEKMRKSASVAALARPHGDVDSVGDRVIRSVTGQPGTRGTARKKQVFPCQHAFNCSTSAFSLAQGTEAILRFICISWLPIILPRRAPGLALTRR